MLEKQQQDNSNEKHLNSPRMYSVVLSSTRLTSWSKPFNVPATANTKIGQEVYRFSGRPKDSPGA
jgi:hypothetical protein